MPAAAPTEFSIHEFLRGEREKDLLRFSTAGSVDDGKSTLIGRLLYDTQSVYEDQVRSIEGKGTTAAGQLDFALLTDGLRAEREQGITIDVAYRYFSTARRKFIIADTPGHEQYTRNMATGASTADAAVVLIDASKGVLVQSRRHAYIASLLRVRHILVAVNKMDLIGFDEPAFRSIERDFREVLDRIADDTGNAVQASFVPVSALQGDNVVSRSDAMQWYAGPSLLELLESLPGSEQARAAQFRFPVQRVLRPSHAFRGFAGQIASGTIRRGESVALFPSARTAKVDRIVTFDGDLDEAFAPMSVTLVLDRELDISRGDLIAAAGAPVSKASRVEAALVWMDRRPLDHHRRYLAKHASHTLPAIVSSIAHRTNISTLAHEPAETLEMNGIGVVSIDLLRPIAFDSYRENRTTGALILIDPETNHTVAAGMILRAIETDGAPQGDPLRNSGPVTEGERQARWGHRGGVLELAGPPALIDSIERSLFALGAATLRIPAGSDEALYRSGQLQAATDLAIQSGLLALVVQGTDSNVLMARAGGEAIEVDAANPDDAVALVHRLLSRAGILTSSERGNPE
jgi:sulfate adenylyltransferase large subunit